MEIDQIRAIRTNPSMRLKSSPYLRDSFMDEFGNEVKVVVRNYQAQGIMNMLQVPRMILSDDTGLGKAQPTDAKVMTPTGWRKMGELRVGDRVAGSDGSSIRVTGVFPQGMKPVYRVIMTDGSSTECCDEHLWTVRSGNTRRSGDGWRTLSLREIMEGGLLRQRNSTGRKWSIPTVRPVEFRERDLPVDPYLLGVLLGDGSMPSHIRICNGDPKLFDLIESRLPPGYRLGKYGPDGYSRPILMAEGTKSGIRSPLKSALKELDLIGKNWENKFIPREYLHASVRQRTDLLCGLMDTDGYVSKDGMVTQFYSSNFGLVKDFVELVQSLGGIAKVAEKVPVLRGKSKAKRGRLAYTVTISLPNQIVPYKLPRKVARWRPRIKYHPTRYIDRVEPAGSKECVCIRVDASDSLYVTDDYIVTHNTLQTLCTIGYVWMMEPEYVPVVITRKSSLYQWDDEIRKFMQNMSAVVVDGEPFERDATYRDFFEGHDPAKKRLLIMTYDTYLKDFGESVVRDRSKKAPKDVRDKLAAARKVAKEKAAAYEPLKAEFRARFDQRNDVVKSYLVERMKPSDEDAEMPASPSDWSADDEALVLRVSAARAALSKAKLDVDAAKDLVEPPVVAAGVKHHVTGLTKAHPSVKLMLVMDEGHVVKNYQGKLHEAVAETAKLCERVIIMTATPVQNRLMEFFSLFRIVVPKLFPKVTHFQNNYCIMKMQRIGGGRQVPIVVGHSKDQMERFVRDIEPFYLSRRKYEVAKELPELITREVVCVLSPEQQDLYEMAELEAEEAQAEADPDKPDTSAMRCMTLIQQASDAPQLVADEDGKPFEGESSKMEALVEILQGAPEMKVLVFSRFKKMVDLVDARLKKERIRYTRVTGDEGAKERVDNVKSYQDPKSGVNVMLITTAGTESLNLQATEHIVLIDSPWSWGVYAQLIGRGVRIGSRNLTVLVTHLIARLSGGKETIDDHVVKTLRGKRKLADAVAGEAIKGGLEFSEEDMVREVMGLVRGAKRSGKVEGVREAVRVRVQSAGAAKRKAKRAAAAENVLSAIEPASPKKGESDLGVYVSMDDI
jgi:hypothetical protein